MKSKLLRPVSDFIRMMTICFAIVAGAGACSSQPEAPPVEEQAVIAELDPFFQAYLDLHSNGDYTNADNFYSDDPRFYWVENGTIQYPDKRSLLDALEQFYPSLKSVTMRTSNQNVTVLNERNAMVYSEFHQEIVMESDYSFTLDGALTVLMVKEEDDQWRFLIGHSSTKRPGERLEE